MNHGIMSASSQNARGGHEREPGAAVSEVLRADYRSVGARGPTPAGAVVFAGADALGGTQERRADGCAGASGGCEFGAPVDAPLGGRCAMERSRGARGGGTAGGAQVAEAR